MKFKTGDTVVYIKDHPLRKLTCDKQYTIYTVLLGYYFITNDLNTDEYITDNDIISLDEWRERQINRLD